MVKLLAAGVKSSPDWLIPVCVRVPAIASEVQEALEALLNALVALHAEAG